MAANKTIALITGSNGGIGYCVAECLAASSPDYIVIITSRNLQRGQTALAELQKQNPKGSFSLVQLDVTDDKSIADAAAYVTKEFGRIDVLVNNAGIISSAPKFADQLRDTFATNTFGAALVTECFQPLLEKSSKGRLIYVTSELGSISQRSDPSNKYYKLPGVAYRMSKTALNMLMVCNVAELGPKGIKVWAFCPGYVVTNLSGTGEKGREQRVQNGADDPKKSAKGILACIDGTRDADSGKFINREGFIEW